MTKLLFVRHGQSMANLDAVFAGHYDVDLSDLGYRQAEKTAEYIMSEYNVDVIYASDLKRAYKTAKSLADKFGMDVIKTKGMREIQCGEWDGKKFSELLEIFPDSYGQWVCDIGNAKCPGGESVCELEERIMRTVREIAEENDGKTVVIATHATPIRIMQTRWQGMDLSHMKDVAWVSNASVTVVDFDGEEFKIERAGYDAHLADIKTKLPTNV